MSVVILIYLEASCAHFGVLSAYRNRLRNAWRKTSLKRTKGGCVKDRIRYSPDSIAKPPCQSSAIDFPWKYAIFHFWPRSLSRGGSRPCVLSCRCDLCAAAVTVPGEEAANKGQSYRGTSSKKSTHIKVDNSIPNLPSLKLHNPRCSAICRRQRWPLNFPSPLICLKLHNNSHSMIPHALPMKAINQLSYGLQACTSQWQSSLASR